MKGVQEIKNLLADSVMSYKESPAGSKQYIEDRCSIKLNLRDGNLEMTEDGKDATLTKIYLIGLDRAGVALKPDNFGVRFFQANSWNKAVDYLVLTTYNSKDYAIYIDLKSSLNDKPDANDGMLIVDHAQDRKKEAQFIGAEALFEYIKMLVKKKNGCNAVPAYEVRKWILYGQIKPQSGVQSPIMSTSAIRRKSKDIHTKQVADSVAIDVKDLI